MKSIYQQRMGSLPYNTLDDVNRWQESSQQQQLNEEKLVQIKQQRVQQAAKQKLLEEAYKNPVALQQLAAIDPDSAMGIMKTQEFQRGQLDYQASRSGQIAEFVAKQPASKKPEAYKQGLQIARQSGLDVSGLPEEYSPEVDMQLEAIVSNSKTTKQQLEEDRIRAEIAKSKMKGDLPSNIQEWEYYNKLSPSDQIRYKEMKRGGTVDKGMYITAEGNVGELGKYSNVSSGIKQAESFGKKTGEITAEKIQNQPKVLSSMESSFAKNDNVLGLIDEIIPKVGQTTAGVGGALISKLPINSEARDLKKQLDTVVANMGFGELQQMRDNSPTGGALGQVTERELAFLQSVKAYLQQDQSPEQLVKNLKRAREDIVASKNRIKAAYDREYGSQINTSSSPKGQIKFLGFE